MSLFGLFKKDTVNTIPENDTEKWILGTYAMWSVEYDGDWKYIASAKKIDRRNRATMCLMLRRDWGVSNKEELFDMVDYLIGFYKKNAAAWDLLENGLQEKKWCSVRLLFVMRCRNCSVHGMSCMRAI